MKASVEYTEVMTPTEEEVKSVRFNWGQLQWIGWIHRKVLPSMLGDYKGRCYQYGKRYLYRTENT